MRNALNLNGNLLRIAALAGVAAILAMAGCKSQSTTTSQAAPDAAAHGPTHPETINYQILLANDKIADKFGGIIGLPTSMLYSRDGKKVYMAPGLLHPDIVSKEIEKQLAIAGSAASSAQAKEASVQIPTLDGGSTSLSQFTGKVVLVNFWATWCQPCREEIPWLIEFNQKYASQGLVILGLAMDDDGKKAVEPWVKTQKFDVETSLGPLVHPFASGN